MRTDVPKLATLMFIFLLYPVFLLLSLPAATADISPESISYMFTDKSTLHISLSTASYGIHTLAADPDNGLVVKVQVRDKSGAAVPGTGVKLESSDSTGSFQPPEGTTDESGSFLSIYIPPASVSRTSGNSSPGKDEFANAPLVNSGHNENSGNSSVNAGRKVLLTSYLSGTDKSSSLQIRLIPVPVVLIHGYQASSTIFSGFSEYLKVQGFTPLSFDYASENGVAASAAELSAFLQAKTAELRAAGIQAGRFDLVAHSMGGLVARYYTCGSEYALRGDIRKLIFLSVPQKGSPFASLGLQYYKDAGMQDLVPDSELYSYFFPSMINAGLNSSIQTGSLLGKYDEVVGVESASLAEWSLETELFDLGESNFTVDKLLTGEILQAANHKLILYNRKVYQRVQQMLESEMSYPSLK